RPGGAGRAGEPDRDRAQGRCRARCAAARSGDRPRPASHRRNPEPARRYRCTFGPSPRRRHSVRSRFFNPRPGARPPGIFQRQADERKRLQAFVDRFKAKASKARQAQSRVKMLERMKPVTALVTQDVHEISFPKPEKTLSPPIIALDDVSVGYEPGKPVLNRVTLRIDTEDRIALLGSNGNGKSTLVKLLANKLQPFSGRITRAEKLSVGYFAQHQVDELNLDASPYDHVRRLMP